MEINHQNIEIMVFPESEGSLSAIGHNLAIEAQVITGKIDGDTIEISVPVVSLRVAGNMPNGQLDRTQPSDKDRKKIEENMLNDVFEAKKFPQVLFHGKRVGDIVTGDLTIHGVTRPIRLELKGGSGSFEVNQSDYSIKPFKAFLGQLRIKSELQVKVTLKGL